MKIRLFFIPAGIIVLTFLIVGSLCDLTIAQALFNQDNGFSRFMAGFSMIPIGIMAGFALGTLFKMVINKQHQKKWQNIVLCLVSFLGAIPCIYFTGIQFTSYHAYNLNSWFCILFGMLSVAPGYLLGYFFFEKIECKNLIKIYLLVGLTVIFLMGITEGIKICFPRLRYTSVVELGVNYYRPWYNFDFSLNKEFVEQFKLANLEEIKSFPSGHANTGLATAFVMMFIPKLFPKFKNKEVFFFYGGFLFFLLVAFSRIFNGAHYLSDTMFAGTLALLVYFISNEIYLRKLV